MVFTSDTFFTWGIDIIKNVNFLTSGTNFLVILGLVVISAIFISPRNPMNIKKLGLPLMAGYKILGLNVPMILMVFAGIVFILDTLSIKQIGTGISAVGQKYTEIVEPFRDRTEKRRTKILKKIEENKKEGLIKDAEENKLIPFRKGTSITDVLNRTKNKEPDYLYEAKTLGFGNEIEKDIQKALKTKNSNERNKILKRVEEFVDFDPEKTTGGGTGKMAQTMREVYQQMKNAGLSHQEAYKFVGKEYKGKFKVKKRNWGVKE